MWRTQTRAKTRDLQRRVIENGLVRGIIEGAKLLDSVWYSLLTACLALLAAAGCVPRDERPSTSTAPQITVSTADKEALDRIIFRNTGRVVLVSFWATWDEASQRQFSHVKVLQDVYGPEGLRVITVSLDDPAVVDAVEDFLSAQRARSITHLISPYGADPQAYEEFEIPGGAVPCYLLYDRMGNLQRVYEGSLVGIDHEISQLIQRTDYELEDAEPKS